jgi:transposase
VVVVDHFHAIRLANTVVDQVRRRTQQATLGHRGRKRDPLYRIRKLLLTAAEQLTQRGRRCPGGGVVTAGSHRASLEAEILAFHSTNGCSNGLTEALNLLIKKVKRAGHGFRNFANYRLRLLLHCGVRWQTHRTARLRGRSPRLVVHRIEPRCCWRVAHWSR